MNSFIQKIKKNWWPISAVLFCPCHLPLSMGALVGITGGTAVGAYLSAHYTTIESVLAVAFSVYFVLAFLIWTVRGPKAADGSACAIDENGVPQRAGLSTRQIIVWGIVSALIMPFFVTASLFVRNDLFQEIWKGVQIAGTGNSGMIWLLSISTIVMIPVMVVWIVWMWVTWSKVDPNLVEPTHWEYDYD